LMEQLYHSFMTVFFVTTLWFMTFLKVVRGGERRAAAYNQVV